MIEFIDAEAEEEFLSLDTSLKAKFLHISELIENFGPFRIGLPHIRHLEDKLWEIRMRGEKGIARSLFITYAGKRLIILHTFIKKTQQTPKKVLDKAKRKLKEVVL